MKFYTFRPLTHSNGSTYWFGVVRTNTKQEIHDLQDSFKLFKDSMVCESTFVERHDSYAATIILHEDDMVAFRLIYDIKLAKYE